MPDTLHAIDLLIADPGFQGRIRASVAKESDAGSIPYQDDPVQAAWENRYAYAVAPTWAEKYQYALDTGVENPGIDPDVIPDAAIQARTQHLFPLPVEPPAVPPDAT